MSLATTGVENEVRAAVAVDTSFASDQVRSFVVGAMAVVCAPHTGAKATGTGGFIVRFITPCQSFFRRDQVLGMRPTLACANRRHLCQSNPAWKTATWRWLTLLTLFLGSVEKKIQWKRP